MNTTKNIVGPLLVFVGLMALLSYFAWRKNRSSWQGIVEQLVHVPGDNEGSAEQFYILCRTDAGKRVKVSLAGQSMLDSYKKGQRVEKKPGQYWPSVLP